MECTWSDGRPRPSSEDRVSSSASARVHCFTAGRSRVPGAKVTLGTNAEVAFCRSDYQAVVRQCLNWLAKWNGSPGKRVSRRDALAPIASRPYGKRNSFRPRCCPPMVSATTPWTSRSASYRSAGSFPVEQVSGAATHQGPLLFDLVRSFQPCHAGTHLLQRRDATSPACLRKRVPAAWRGWVTLGNVTGFHLRTARRAACPRRLRSVRDRRSS
jgi:hypothetical protein